VRCPNLLWRSRWLTARHRTATRSCLCPLHPVKSLSTPRLEGQQTADTPTITDSLRKYRQAPLVAPFAKHAEERRYYPTCHDLDTREPTPACRFINQHTSSPSPLSLQPSLSPFPPSSCTDCQPSLHTKRWLYYCHIETVICMLRSKRLKTSPLRSVIKGPLTTLIFAPLQPRIASVERDGILRRCCIR
jgi:hypothetical protein